MGAFIGSTSIELHGEQVDINDDERLRGLLTENTRKLVATRSPLACKNILVAVLADVQLVTVKLAFVLNQTALRGAAGVGIQTLAQFYDQMAKIAGIETQAAGPQLLDANGNPVDGGMAVDVQPANEPEASEDQILTPAGTVAEPSTDEL